MTVKLSDLSQDKQIVILKTMCDTIHTQLRTLQININPEGFGTETMNSEHRLMNRLVVDFVNTDMGIPSHDNEAQQWVNKVLKLSE